MNVFNKIFLGEKAIKYLALIFSISIFISILAIGAELTVITTLFHFHLYFYFGYGGRTDCYYNDGLSWTASP